VRPEWPPIGIAGIATELADTRVDSEEFARISNIPPDALETRLGFREVFRWGDGCGHIATGARCASRALAGLDPREVDLICTIAHPYHPEREVYGYGALLQDALGAENAELLDVANTCASVTLALQTVRELMLSHPEIRNALVVGIVTTFGNLDLSNPRTTWMANLSDGAGAMLVRRDSQLDNIMLETAQLVDAQFIDDVAFASPYMEEPIDYRTRFRRFLPLHVDVVDKTSFKERLDQVTMSNYIQAARESLGRSGFTADQVDYVGANRMKPRAWEELLGAFGLSPEGQINFDAGHVGPVDQFLFLQSLRDERRLPRGGLAVLATPGVGFHWTVTTVAFKGPRLEALTAGARSA
jgi:3-oxoacyl-[acyl-carrier-protein] synthase III